MASNQTIASMSVRISATTQELQAGLNNASKEIANFNKKFGEIGKTLAGVFAVDKIAEFTKGIVDTEGTLQGVSNAFNKLDEPGLLDNLRKATKGTVSDLNLMKLSVQAKNFKIPLSQLSTYLEFARRRAQDTGQSVDYMTDSIITGLGRESPRILDNLGISAKQIEKEFQRTGNFAIAFGNIVRQEMSTMGPSVDTLTDKSDRLTSSWDKFKEVLGKGVAPVASALFEMMGSHLDAINTVVEDPTLSKFNKWLLFLNGSGDIIEKRKKQWEEYKDQIDILTERHELNATSLNHILTSLKPTMADYKLFIRAIQEYGNAKIKSDLFAQYRDEVDKLSKANNLNEGTLNGVLLSINKNIHGYDALKNKVKQYGESLIQTNPKGKIEIINKELEEIAKKRSQEENESMIASYNKQEAILKKKLEYYNNLGKPVGEIAKLEKKISDLEEKQKGLDGLALIRNEKEVEKLKDKLDLLKAEAEILKPIKGKGLGGSFDTHDAFTVSSSKQTDINALKPTSIPVDREKWEQISKAGELAAQKLKDSWQEAFDDISQSLNQTAINIGEAFGNMVVSGKADWTSALLTPFGDLLIQLGEISIAAGIGIKAIKAAFSSLNPYVAVAAGVGLIALGTAIKSSVSALGSSTGSSSSTSSGSSYSVSNSAYGANMSSASSQQKIEVTGTIKASGKDLVLIVDRNRDTMSRER